MYKILNILIQPHVTLKGHESQNSHLDNLRVFCAVALTLTAAIVSMSNTLVQYLHAFAFPYLVWHSSAKQSIVLFVRDQKEFGQQAQSCRRAGRRRGTGPSRPAAADAPAAPRAAAAERPHGAAGAAAGEFIQEDGGRTCDPSRVSRTSSGRAGATGRC